MRREARVLTSQSFVLAAVATLVGAVALGQNLTKEYIYVGGRLIAVKTPMNPITVTINPTSGTLESGQALQFTATVTNGSQNVTWTLNGPGSLTPTSTANPVTFQAASVTQSTPTTLRATSDDDPDKFDEVTVTTNPQSGGGGVTVTIAGSGGPLMAAETAQYTASAEPGGHTTAVWSITAGQYATINSSTGLLTVDNTVPTTGNVTVHVEVDGDPSKTDTHVVQLLASGGSGPPPDPQLTITRTGSAPPDVDPGQSFGTVQYSINTDIAATGVSVEYYLSPNSSIFSGTLLGQSTNISTPLNPGAATVTSPGLTVPSGTTPGFYKLIAFVKQTGDSPDIPDCSSNTFCDDVEVTSPGSPPPGLPDLIGSFLVNFPPGTATTNEWIIATGAVANVASPTWSPPAGTMLELRGVLRQFPSGQQVGQQTPPAWPAPDPIGAGPYAAPQDLIFPPQVAGVYETRVLADPNHNITELDESNNEGGTAITTVSFVAAQEPDLVCNGISVGPTISPGQTIQVDCTDISNVGTLGGTGTFQAGIYLSEGSTIDTTDERLGTCSPSPLTVPAVSDSTSCSGTVTIPATTVPGQYHIGVYIDENSQIAEEQEMNNSAGQPLIVSGPPVAGTVTPSIGQGAGPQTFTFTMTDPNGANDIHKIYVRFNGGNYWPGACAVIFDNQSDWIYVTGGGVGGYLGSSAVTSVGPNCELDVQGGSVSRTGNQVTLQLPFTFTTQFSATRTIQLYGNDLSGAWSTIGAVVGTWTFPGSEPNVPPTNSAGSPATLLGLTETISVTASDPNGASDIEALYIRVSNSPSLSAPSCYIRYDQRTNLVYLLGSPSPAFSPGSPNGILSNSSCDLDSAGVMKSTDGNDLTLTYPITINSGLSGQQLYVYQWTADNSGFADGWDQVIDWDTTSAVPQAPMTGTVTPSSGSGAQQTFTVTASDANGASNIWRIYTQMNVTSFWPGACGVIYDHAANWIRVTTDSGGWGPSAVPGDPVVLSNSACQLDVSDVQASPAGTQLSLTLPLTFTTNISATRNIYQYVLDVGGLADGFDNLGSWGFPGSVANVTPVIGQAAPGAASGASETFTIKASDANGASDLATMYLRVGPSISLSQPACYIRYDVINDWVSLYGAAGGFTPGVDTGTISDSNCNVHADGASKAVNVNEVSLTLPIEMTGLSGQLGLFQYSSDMSGVVDGWEQVATWDTSAGSPPTSQYGLNMSFESPGSVPPNWMHWPDGAPSPPVPTTVTSPVRSGTYAVEADLNPPQSPNFYGQTLWQDISNLTPGSVYRVEAWVRGEAGSTDEIRMSATDTGWSSHAWDSVSPVPTNSWHKLSIDFVPQDDGQLSLSFHNFTGGKKFYVDDVTVNAVTNADGTNLGFEDSTFSPWASNGATLTVTSVDDHSGTQSLDVDMAPAPQLMWQNFFNLTTGTTYRLTARVKGAAGSNDSIEMRATPDEMFGQTLSTGITATDGHWQQMQIDFPYNGTWKLGIEFHNPSGAYNFFVDDVTVVEVQ